MPGFHGGFGLVEVPALGFGAGKSDRVQRVEVDEQIHDRCRDEVNVLHRLAQDGHAVGEGVHFGGILRNDKELLIRIGEGEQGIAPLVAVGCELGCVVQRVAVAEHQLVRIGGGGLHCAAAEQKGRGGKGFQKIAT